MKMSNINYILTISLCWPLLSLLYLGAATRECAACIPLKDLTSYAHGVSLSVHRLDSAIKFHNGTLKWCASIEPSHAYVQLLQQFEIESSGSGLGFIWSMWNHAHPPVALHVQDDGFMSNIRHWVTSRFLSSTRSLSPSPSDVIEPLPPLTAEAEVFYDELCRLRNTVEADGDPMHNIGLSVPLWLTDAQAMHIFSAADRANLSIRDIGHPPLAVAAFHDLDLCRVPSEYIPCQADHVMTLDLSDTELTAAVVYLRPNGYLGQYRTYSVNHHLGATQLDADGVGWEELTTWINDFAENNPVNKLYLIGPKATHPILYHAVHKSDLAHILQEKGNVPPYRTVALGAAEMTKENMEQQNSDCTEFEACEQIREEADRLAGRPAWRVRPPHSEL